MSSRSQLPRFPAIMVTMEELREMDCSVLKRLMNRDEISGGAGGSSSHGALGLLSGGKCLLLDCRPFLAHSAGYIRGSVNVRCNTIVRRRAKGSVSLEQILPAEEEVRSRLRSGLYSAVIVYDERSPRAESLREDSTVSLVVQALRRNAERTDICLLKGKHGCRGPSWRADVMGLGGRRLTKVGKEVTPVCGDPFALLCACWSARDCQVFVRFCASEISQVLRNEWCEWVSQVTVPHASHLRSVY